MRRIHRNRSTPRLARLEDRTVPAALDVVNGTLTYTAGDGKANSVHVFPVGDELNVSDTGDRIALGPGAAAGGWAVVTDVVVRGPAAGVRALDFRLGDRDDSLDLEPLGPDAPTVTVDGGPGDDSFRFSVPRPAGSLGQTVTVDDGQVVRDGQAVVRFADVSSVWMATDAGDTVTIHPSATTSFEVNNQGSVWGSTLHLSAPAGTASAYDLRSAGNAGQQFYWGTWTALGFQPVRFQWFETLNPLPAVAVVMSGPPPQPTPTPSGTVIAYRVEVTNTTGRPLAGLPVQGALTDITGGTPSPLVADALWTAAGDGGSVVGPASGAGPVAATLDLAAGGRVVFTVIVRLRPGTSGMLRHAVTVTIPASAMPEVPTGRLTSDMYTQVDYSLRPAAPTDLIAVGAGPGGAPRVRVYNADGSVRFDFNAYDPAFRGGVRVATGDVTGDGVEDVISAPGAGGGPHVKVFDGVSGRLVREWMAYDPAFRGGAYVAAGYIVGDAKADVVTGAGEGGGPHVKVFDGNSGALAREWLAYDPGFRGGVRVAVGDLTGASDADTGAPAGGDGIDDVVTAPGADGGPHVRVFDGFEGMLVEELLVGDPASRDGAFVAAGDVTGDGKADLIAGPGRGPRAAVYGAVTFQEVRSFAPFGASFAGGVRAAVADVNGDGRAELVVGTGPGEAARAVVLDGATGTPTAELSFDPAFTGGVFVG